MPAYEKVCQDSLSRNISILLFQKWYKKVSKNGENAYLVMKNFVCMTPLRGVGKNRPKIFGPPLNQILDLPLFSKGTFTCTIVHTKITYGYIFHLHVRLLVFSKTDMY